MIRQSTSGTGITRPSVGGSAKRIFRNFTRLTAFTTTGTGSPSGSSTRANGMARQCRVCGLISRRQAPRNVPAIPPRNRLLYWNASSRPAANPATLCSIRSAAAPPPASPLRSWGDVGSVLMSPKWLRCSASIASSRCRTRPVRPTSGFRITIRSTAHQMIYRREPICPLRLTRCPSISACQKEAVKQRLYDQQEGKCNGCERHFTPEFADLMDLDHIKPKSKGGLHTWSNVQLLCRTCNVRKGSGTMAQLRKRLQQDVA